MIPSKPEVTKTASIALTSSNAEKSVTESKLSGVSSAKVGASSLIEKTVTDTKLSGVTSTKVGASSQFEKNVTEHKLSGVSSTKAGASSILEKTVTDTKLSGVSSIKSSASSQVEKTVMDKKISGESSTKAGTSPHVEKTVTDIKLSGVSSAKAGATVNLVKPGLTGQNRTIQIVKPINRTNTSIPKVELSSSQKKVPITFASTGVAEQNINKPSHSSKVNTQSLDSGKGIDIKKPSPEIMKKESDTSGILQQGNSSNLHKTELSSNFIKCVTGQ